MDNKNIFSSNLKRYMAINDKSRKDVSEALGISYYTITDWVNGKKYPRMDKVEKLAEYFGVLKSDLIEEKKTTDNDGLSEEEKELLDLFTRVPADSRPMILEMIRAAVNTL